MKIYIHIKNLINNIHLSNILFYNIDTIIKPLTNEYIQQDIHYNNIAHISIYIYVC